MEMMGGREERLVGERKRTGGGGREDTDKVLSIWAGGVETL